MSSPTIGTSSTSTSRTTDSHIFPEDSWSGPYVHQLAMLRELSKHAKHRITTPVLEIPNSVHLPGGLGVVYDTFPETLTGQGFPVTFSMDNASDVVEVGAPVGRALLSGPGAKPK